MSLRVASFPLLVVCEETRLPLVTRTARATQPRRSALASCARRCSLRADARLPVTWADAQKSLSGIATRLHNEERTSNHLPTAPNHFDEPLHRWSKRRLRRPH